MDTKKSNAVFTFEIKPETTPVPQQEAHVDSLVITPTEKALMEYNHCPLCSAELIFTHVTNFSRHQVVEEAQCESCNIKTLNNLHSLQ
jgi:hypothetical protein